MHKYMRAIGFSEYSDRKKLKNLLTDVIMNSDQRAYTINQEGIMLGEFCKHYAGRMGIAVCGEFDEEDKFIYEYFGTNWHMGSMVALILLIVVFLSTWLTGGFKEEDTVRGATL